MPWLQYLRLIFPRVILHLYCSTSLFNLFPVLVYIIGDRYILGNRYIIGMKKDNSDNKHLLWRGDFQVKTLVLVLFSSWGAFLVPYVLFLLSCGIPMFFLETAMGQYTSQGCITCWRHFCPLFEGSLLGSPAAQETGLCLCCAYAVAISKMLCWAASTHLTLPHRLHVLDFVYVIRKFLKNPVQSDLKWIPSWKQHRIFRILW